MAHSSELLRVRAPLDPGSKLWAEQSLWTQPAPTWGDLEAPKDGPALKNFLKGHLTALPSLCLKPCIFQSWSLG